MVWPPGQSVSLIKGSRFMNDGEVKLGEEERPASLSTGKFLFGTEVRKVVVVGPSFEWLGVSFEVVTKEFQGADDGKKFFVMDVIV
jgi:hypothetical protein